MFGEEEMGCEWNPRKLGVTAMAIVCLHEPTQCLRRVSQAGSMLSVSGSRRLVSVFLDSKFRSLDGVWPLRLMAPITHSTLTH